MYTYKAKLMRVVDGDTVDAETQPGFGVFMKQRIRLYGINNPRIPQETLKKKKEGWRQKHAQQNYLEKNPQLKQFQ